MRGRSEGSPMDLTDEELSALHTLILEEALYGDDHVVYGDGPQAVMIRTLLEKVTDEAKRRNFWWAR
jgi:hypothetical protein